MIDLKKIESYRENNRIEAKKALGGFPQSFWETYSAFANTMGGIILLGVVEHADHSLYAVDLPNPDKLIAELWRTVNNTEKVSVNILSNKNVSVEMVDGKRIVVVNVPRAHRFDRPVYVGNNPLCGAYRRNGEGDYKCTKEEVRAMLRDAAIKTQDMCVLENCTLLSLEADSVRRYRNRMKSGAEHAFENLEDVDFLHKIGAVAQGADGKLHPTAAGLLMFGLEKEIVKEFPDYLLEYKEQSDENGCWTERIVSSSDDWSGNVCDFYFRICDRFAQNSFARTENGNKIDYTPICNAMKEALANCLINADYYGKQGVVIVKRKNRIDFSNPGSFRIDVEAAKTGGVSDPRNGALIKMFSLVDVGERSGSGIPNIYSVWEKQGWATPSITESFNPERTTLSLVFGKTDNKTTTAKYGANTLAQKAAIVEYLTDNASGTNADFRKLLGVKSARIKELLAELVTSEIVVAEGASRNPIYRLKR